MRYTLRQLEVFLAVARTGSVSRAGDEIAMSQSAVSGALADLERQFDVRLFDRIGALAAERRGAGVALRGRRRSGTRPVSSRPRLPITPTAAGSGSAPP
jgi:DNA-binding transcriptional LysR family regulator